MERLNTYLTKHLWAQYAVSVLLGAVLVQLLYPGRSFPEIVARLAVISLGGLAVILSVRRRERRAAGGTDGLVTLDQRLRRGEPPTDPEERRAMRVLVDQRLHRSRHRVAAFVVLALMFVTITVLTGLTAGTRQTVGFAVLTVVFLGWTAYAGNRQTRRLRAMDAALRGEASETGADAPLSRRRQPTVGS
ncbi:hypothetical protein [Streptomyces sp. NPDC046939]|uniref:hypothetical protein n=1 Tax=Streptomyces sp. NPDC046939 TaxID=3155376 RepID=UPI0033E9B48D